MKKNSFFILIFAMLLSGILSSCDNDDENDTIKPTINLIYPEEGATLIIGDEEGIHFKAEFSDNDKLSSYKIDIHNSDNGHTHSLRTEVAPFSLQRSWNLPETSEAIAEHYEIVIPATARHGNYHLVVYCTDKAGNETYVARNIVLENSNK